MGEFHPCSPRLAVLLSLGIAAGTLAQPPQCHPSRVVGADACARCHGSETAVWRGTPHFRTFEELAHNPRAQEITSRLGMASVKRNDLCIQCHFLTQEQGDGKARAIAGVACESCHGAARDWISLHSDYGGPGITRESESDAHRADRLHRAELVGMRNTRNLYLIACSCLQCHTVPNEQLVNQGGHAAGSQDFELVAWSQGMVRHNFVRTGGLRNDESPRERLRVMYVCGLIADLEFSTRATARATTRDSYGLAVGQRAARVASRLLELQATLNDPLVDEVLQVFASAELRTRNASQLDAIAGRIAEVGTRFASERDGTTLAAVDAHLPSPASFRR